MKDYHEIAKDVFERRDQYLMQKKQNKIRFLRYGVPAICVCLVVGLCVFVAQTGKTPSFPEVPSSDVSSNVSVSSPLTSSTVPSSLPSADSSAPENSKTESKVTSEEPHKQPDSEVSAPDSSAVIKPNKDIKNEDINYDNSSAMPSPSIPTVDSSYDYDTIDSFMNKLDSVYEVEIKGPQDTSSTTSSTVSEPSPPGDASVEVSMPEAPDMSNVYEEDVAKPSPDSTNIWQQVAWMFEDGTFLLPDLGEGNDDMVLDDILVNNEGLYYLYHFRDAALHKENGDLLVKIPSDTTTAKNEFETMRSNGLYDRYSYKGVSFYVVGENGIKTIYWQQYGGYYKAYYNGSSAFLQSILPELRLWYYYWVEI